MKSSRWVDRAVLNRFEKFDWISILSAAALALSSMAVPTASFSQSAMEAGTEALKKEGAAIVAEAQAETEELKENLAKYVAYIEENLCRPEERPVSVEEWGPLARLAENANGSVVSRFWLAKYRGGYISHTFSYEPGKACFGFGRTFVEKKYDDEGLKHGFSFYPSGKPGVLLLTMIETDRQFRMWVSPPIEVRVTPNALLTGEGANEHVLLSVTADGRYVQAFEELYFETGKVALKEYSRKGWSETLNPYFMAQGKEFAKSLNARMQNAYDAAADKVRREKRQARWEMFGRALGAFAEGYSQAMADSARMEDRLTSGLHEAVAEGQRKYEARVAAEAASQSQPGSGPVDHVASGSSSAQPASSQTSASAQPRVAPNTGSNASSAGSSTVAGRSSANASAGSSTASKLIATPEAILVCTRPDPTTGKFTCATPVSARLDGGPKSDLAAHRTPELMAASLTASCPEQRPLPSTTHLVWGCGFGATNNSAQMDRSAGVEVRDRRTYYCYPKETSCRKTTPE